MTHVYDLNYAVVRREDRVYVSREGYAGLAGTVKEFGQYPNGVVWASVEFDNGLRNRFSTEELYKIGGVK